MKEDHQQDPEGIYEIYKKNRARSAPVDVVPVDLTDFTPGEDVADQVYRRYQQTRVTETSAVDEIMQVIASASEGDDSHHVEDQPARAATGDVNIDSIDNSVGRFGWLRKFSGGNDGGKVGKLVLPAVAAAIFAFVLLPFVSNKNNGDQRVDTAHLSPDLAPYVEPHSASMLGFSSPANERGHSFLYGVLATDLIILKESASSPGQVKALVQSYLQDTIDSPGEIDLAAQQVVALSVASDDSQSISAEIVESIDTLLKAIRTHTSSHANWFELGESIESVVLASQHALSTSNSSLLQSAMRYGRNVTVPTEDTNLKNLVGDLLSEEVSDAMATADIRRILNKAQDIKTVAQ